MGEGGVTFKYKNFNLVNSGNREFTFFNNSPQDIQDIIDDETSIEEFFELYNQLFYLIPILGENNSHEFILKNSGKLTSIEETQEEVSILQNEISEIRKQNLDLQLKIIKLENPKMDINGVNDINNGDSSNTINFDNI
jgi:hypothetical protein